jgi:hypothetical protein
MGAGRYAEACPAFEESLRLDFEMGTLLNLAFCHDHENKPGRAWREYEIARARCLTTNDRRAAFAGDSAKKLEDRVSWIELAATRGATLADVVVDGDALPAVDAARFAVDPGQHVVAAHASGQQPWQQTVEIAAHATVKLTVDAPPAPVSPPAAAAPAAVSATPPAATDDHASSGRPGRRVAAYVVGGVGVVGIAVGAAFGAETLSDKSKADANGCTNGTRCLQGTNGRSYGEQAWTYSAVSTVGFGVGLAGLAAGTWLFLTSRPQTSTASAGARPEARTRATEMASHFRVSPYAGPGGAGLTALGIW